MISWAFFSAVLMCAGERWIKRVKEGSGKEKFRTYDEYVEIIDEMLQAHPKYLRKEEIGKSVEGRSLFVLLLGHTTPTHPQEEVFIAAGEHPMEAISPLGALDFLAKILDDVKAGRVEALHMTQRRLVVIDPFVNPDGVIAMDKGGSEIRKNRADVCTTGGQQGVDLSQNYPDAPKSTGGPRGRGKSRECSDTYGGAAPFDQPETTAIKELVEKHKFAIALSIHAKGRRIIYPDGVTREQKRFFRKHEKPSKVRKVAAVASMQKGRKAHTSSGGMINWLYKQGVLATFLEAGDVYVPSHERKEAVLSSIRGYIRFLVSKAGCDPVVSRSGSDLQVENTGLGKCHKLRVLVHSSGDPIIVDVGDLEAGEKKAAVGTGTTGDACVQETDVPFCACNVTEDVRTQWFRGNDQLCGGTLPTPSTTGGGEQDEDDNSYWFFAIGGVILLLPCLVWVCLQCKGKPKKKKKRPHAQANRRDTILPNRRGAPRPRRVTTGYNFYSESTSRRTRA